MTQFTEMLGSVVLSEEVRENINAAWEKHLSESRESVTAELREEFAGRYEHDKSQLIEAMDKLMQDTISAGATDLKSVRESALAQRTKYAAKIKEDSALLQKLVLETLSKEVAELRNDRASSKAAIAQLEEFALRKLTGELSELHEDHKSLVNARVKLVAEGRRAIEEAKSAFVKKASEKVNAIVAETFKKEITQLKTDIREAKENNFGRKIMEAFAAEFMASGFADGTQVKRLGDQMETLNQKLDEQAKLLESKDQALAQAQKKIRIAEDAVKRQSIMQELVSPLSKEKRGIMEDLLKTTATESLREAYNKYLPAVLNETTKVTAGKQVISESSVSQKTAVTGDKTSSEESAPADIISLRKLAGIGKN